MTEYYGNKLCISVREIDADDILTGDYRRQNAKRDRLKMAGRVGGKGDYTLAVAGSLPAPYPGQVKEGCPGGNAALLRGWILPYCEPDQAAAYFMDWAARRRSGKAADGLAGKHAVNAPALNACIRHYGRSRDSRKLTGGECNRGMMPAAVGTLHGESGYGSPANTLRFRRKVNEYKRYGCGRLISGKSGSQSARKTDYRTRRLILSLAAQEGKPYNSNAHETYSAFVCGGCEAWGQCAAGVDYGRRKAGCLPWAASVTYSSSSGATVGAFLPA